MTAIPSQRISVDNSFDALKSNNIHTDCAGHVFAPLDIVDNPVFSKTDIADRNIFHHMKSEHNRLYSFQNTWPLREVSPKHLADAGFFYLQQEDIVQCPFCEVKISNWICKDNPLREHMRRSPMCPFLRGCDVGNVSLVLGENQPIHLNSSVERKHLPQDLSVSYKPKHPRMADIKRRILTFSNWPLNQPAAQQLSECGLFYSGVADVVTCFFCGGALGNWEPDDDPWNEHTKFFPDCAFLGIAKNRNARCSSKVSGASRQESKESLELKQAPCNGMPLMDSMSDIIEQAQAIFPNRLVSEVVKRKQDKIFSLQEICDDILEMKQKQSIENSQVIPNNSENKVISNDESQDTSEYTKFKVNSSSTNNDILLCKVCMDREKSAVFQPCGHFVCCWNCSNLVSNCPLCRRPITHKIRTYIG